MNDLNVALRLSLVNQMKAGAEDARRDLQKIKAEADKLGKANAALSPASLRAAQQTRQIETQKALAVERTTAAYRRQRSEMLAGDLAARRVDRARDVRAAREVARMRRETRSAQTAMAAAGMAGRGIEWMPDARALRSSEAARRARLDAMTTTMAAQRAAEARALRDVHLGRAAAPARAPGAVPPVPATAGGAAAAGAAGAAGGVAASGKAAGLTYARSFVGGLGIGIGAAAVGQFVKESILGAATDEFERDQLRVLGNISEKQMEAFRKDLDRTARLRGIGSQGALGTFGGLMAGGLSAKESAAFVDPVAIFSKATGASLPDATRSTVALRNNMGLTTAEEIMAAYDAIAVGGKAGEFEVADMASHMPSLLAKMQKLGEGGVSGVRNMVAMAQAIRQTVGTSAEAATNFENMLDKFTANDFVQNARKFGINVEKTMKDAEKNGLSPVFAMLQAIERKTGGDPFKIAKLMPDRQASAAVLAVLGRMDLVMQILSESSEAAGSTMHDYETATDNAWESWNRFSSTIIEKSKAVAESALPAITAAMDSVTDAMSDGKVGASGLLAELQRLNSGATLNFDADEYLKGLKGEYEGDTLLSRFFGASRGQKDILTPVLNWLNGRAKHLNKGLFGESERERWDRYMSLRGKPAPAPTRMTQGPRAAEDASMEEYRGLLNSGHLEAILD
ncbi:MAG: phage tail tape measure protein, partial [Novosphingobium sp.]